MIIYKDTTDITIFFNSVIEKKSRIYDFKIVKLDFVQESL
jgi:hypothetical protein